MTLYGGSSLRRVEASSSVTGDRWGVTGARLGAPATASLVREPPRGRTIWRSDANIRVDTITISGVPSTGGGSMVAEAECRGCTWNCVANR